MNTAIRLCRHYPLTIMKIRHLEQGQELTTNKRDYYEVLGVPRDAAGEEVGRLAFSLVAPLGSDDDDGRHGGPFRIESG